MSLYFRTKNIQKIVIKLLILFNFFVHILLTTKLLIEFLKNFKSYKNLENLDFSHIKILIMLLNNNIHNNIYKYSEKLCK